MVISSVTQVDIDRLWSKIDVNGPMCDMLGTRCWQWTGWLKCEGGYGKFKNVPVHRFVFQLVYGPIGKNYVVDHRCHNTSCVNPEHLRPGTQKQNSENRGVGHNSRTGVRGVSLGADGRFRAGVRHNRKWIHVGYFVSLDEAKRAVIQKRNELFSFNDADR